MFVHIRSVSKEVILKTDGYVYIERLFADNILCKIEICVHHDELKSYGKISTNKELITIPFTQIKTQFDRLTFLVDSDFKQERKYLIALLENIYGKV